MVSYQYLTDKNEAEGKRVSNMLDMSFDSGLLDSLLTLSAHAREGCLSVLDCGEGAVFSVETYISTF